MSINPDTLAALQSGEYEHIVGLVRFDFTGVGGQVVRLASSQFDVTTGLAFSELATMTVGVYNNRYGFRSRSINPFGDCTLPDIGGYPVVELYGNVGSDKIQCQFDDPGVQLTGVDTVTWVIEGQSVDMTWEPSESQYVALNEGAFADHVASFLGQTVNVQLIGTASGETFFGSGQILAVGNVNEASEIRIEPASFEFSGVDQTLTAIFLNNSYVGVPVWYARAVLDANYQVIGDPIIYMIGTVDGPGGNQDDEEARLIIEAESYADFDRINGRRMTPADIERVFPGDKGAEFSGEPQQRGVWGRKK